MSNNSCSSCSCSDPTNTTGAGSSPPIQIPVCEGTLSRSIFHVPGMDCPSEEQIIRLRLTDEHVQAMSFDLHGRTLTVDHYGDVQHLLILLQPLGYGARLQGSNLLQEGQDLLASETIETRVLWILLIINALMFFVEIIAGWLTNSAGLISDAADMFADAAVYGVALFAVGKTVKHQLFAARIAGFLQLILALGALSETGQKILIGSSPDELGMIGISLIALAANVYCFWLIAQHRHRGAHMQASFIFSANDVLANLGVIIAGALVYWTASPWPDWVIGFVIGIMVLLGSVRILRIR